MKRQEGFREVKKDDAPWILELISGCRDLPGLRWTPFPFPYETGVRREVIG